MGFLTLFWKPIAAVVGILLLLVALTYAKHRYDEGKREEGRQEVKEEWAADTKRRIAATTAITMLWDTKRQEAEKATTERDNERVQRFADAVQRARNLAPAVARAIVPGAVRELLNAAVDNSTATPAAAGEPVKASAAAPEDTSAGAIAEWGVQVIAVCTEYRDRALSLIQFYESLRSSQGNSGAASVSAPTAP